MHRFVEKVIEERKLYHKRTSNKYLQIFEDNCARKTDDAEVYESKKKPLAMLDPLIKIASENYWSDSDIKEEVNNFMVATNNADKGEKSNHTQGQGGKTKTYKKG